MTAETTVRGPIGPGGTGPAAPPENGRAERFAHLARRHPCLGEAHANSGRVHLPVSPSCDIRCRFCARAFNDAEDRPGVTNGLVTPEDAPDFVAKALALCPAIAVAGIAGPGDALATGHALEAFRRIRARFPDLILCMSTNGLLLPERAAEIADAGVSTLTVTVNGVRPGIVARIVAWVRDAGRTLRGTEGAQMLIGRQLEGIRAASAAGTLVKVNMVLIPGWNDGNVGDTAAAVRDAGASLFNLIPLIPQGELAGFAPPDCAELSRAREEAERSLPVFRHCTHCRADACGIPGVSEHSAELYGRQAAGSRTFSHG